MAYSVSLFRNSHETDIPLCLNFTGFHFGKRLPQPASDLLQHFPTRKPCFRFTNCQPRAALTFHTALSARASRVLGKYAFSASRHPDPKTLTPKPDLYRSPSPKVWQFSKGWPSAPYFHQIQVQALTQLIPYWEEIPLQ